mmetsp:Transcript_18761/g.52229  ORF Transcript_18761/g.52229 Transcript_18761/m.52229 type:complete len:997 (-) Transcript_18761:398-3388(-)
MGARGNVEIEFNDDKGSTSRWRSRLPSQIQTQKCVLWGILVVVGCVLTFDLAVCATAPCPFFEFGSPEALKNGRCVEEFDMVSKAWNLVLKPLAYSGIFLIFARQLLHVRRVRGGCALSRHFRRRSPLPLEAGTWVCAASPDLFQDTINLIRASNVLNGIISIPLSLLLVVSHLSFDVTDFEHRFESEEWRKACGNSDMCYVSMTYGSGLEILSFHLLAAPLIQFITTPAMVWGPAMTLALRKCRDSRRSRLARSPTLALLGLVLMASQNMYRALRIETSAASSLEATSFLSCQGFILLFNFFLLWNSCIVQDTASFVGKQLEAGLPTSLARKLSLQISDLRLSDADVAHRQEIILITLILLIIHSRFTTGVPGYLVGVIIAEVVVLLVLLALSSERECSFKELEQGAAFGLVVRATSLKRVLQALLATSPDRCTMDCHGAVRYTSDDGTGSGVSVLMPKLQMHKATVERMQNTLAVSYRWQAEQRQLGGGLKLNMNTFQTRTLIYAIEKAQAKYVWLDCLSVPQDESPLKYTLLARMMAVFAAAEYSVAIRTAEAPGSRYHERAWTCQEYCAAKRLEVVTESEWEGNRVAVLGDEDIPIKQQREMFQRAGNSVVPYWLMDHNRVGFQNQAEACALLDRYDSLSSCLHCQVPSDKIRALLPLLTRAPVESQQELTTLVLQLSKASGRPLQEMKAGLLDMHMHIHQATNGGDGRVHLPSRLDHQDSVEMRRSNKGNRVHFLMTSDSFDNHEEATAQWWSTKSVFVDTPTGQGTPKVRRSMSVGIRSSGMSSRYSAGDDLELFVESRRRRSIALENLRRESFSTGDIGTDGFLAAVGGRRTSRLRPPTPAAKPSGEESWSWDLRRIAEQSIALPAVGSAAASSERLSGYPPSTSLILDSVSDHGTAWSHLNSFVGGDDDLPEALDKWSGSSIARDFLLPLSTAPPPCLKRAPDGRRRTVEERRRALDLALSSEDFLLKKSNKTTFGSPHDSDPFDSIV